MLAIAAATDYGIFLFGRYHEARGMGEDREDAYYTMFNGTAHVIAGLRPDHRRRHLLPQFRPAAVLPATGRPARDRHGRGRGMPR